MIEQAQRIIMIIAKLFAWVYGVQVLFLYILAETADKPFPLTSDPAIRFAGALFFVIFGRRLFSIIRQWGQK